MEVIKGDTRGPDGSYVCKASRDPRAQNSDALAGCCKVARERPRWRKA